MMRILIQLLLPMFLVSCSSTAEKSGNSSKTSTGMVIVLREGDDVLETLRKVAREKKISGATFQAIGFVKARFGFFDWKKKVYEPFDVEGELASLTGTVAWEDGEPSLHAHGVVTGRDFKAYGGHLLQAVVGKGSVEITIIEHGSRFYRAQDPELGARVLNFSGGEGQEGF